MNDLCLKLSNGRLRISPFAFLAPALMLYIEGKTSFLIIMSAALLHEMGHILAIYALGSRVTLVFIHTVGAVIHYDSSAVSYKGEAMIAFAGPLANIMFALLSVPAFTVLHSIEPLLFIASCLFFALFNLLPIMGNDGSNALYALTANAYGTERAEKAVRTAAVVSSVIGVSASFALYEAAGACPAVLVMLIMTAVGFMTFS